MKKFLFFIILMSTSLSQEKAILIVKVTGFENHDGDLRIAVTHTKETYLTDNALYAQRIKVNADTMTVTITNLEFGEYAIQAYHDEDSNKELTTNFLGIPTERYGFSNNARGTFGPADYKDSKFLINQSHIEMTITLK